MSYNVLQIVSKHFKYVGLKEVSQKSPKNDVRHFHSISLIIITQEQE